MKIGYERNKRKKKSKKRVNKYKERDKRLYIVT